LLELARPTAKKRDVNETATWAGRAIRAAPSHHASAMRRQHAPQQEQQRTMERDEPGSGQRAWTGLGATTQRSAKSHRWSLEAEA